MTDGRRWKAPQTEGPPQHGVEVRLRLGLARKGEQSHDEQSDLTGAQGKQERVCARQQGRGLVVEEDLEFSY